MAVFAHTSLCFSATIVKYAILVKCRESLKLPMKSFQIIFNFSNYKSDQTYNVGFPLKVIPNQIRSSTANNEMIIFLWFCVTGGTHLYTGFRKGRHSLTSLINLMGLQQKIKNNTINQLGVWQSLLIQAYVFRQRS